MIKAILAFSGVALAAGFLAPAARQSSTLNMVMEDRSIALPMDKRPKNLDGTRPGDVGFDPAGFSNNPPKGIGAMKGIDGLKWYQESEIVHGRVAMLAVVGNLWPGWIGHLPGNPEYGVPVDGYAELNPFTALSVVPASGLYSIALTIFAIELWRIKNVIKGDKPAGYLALGQKGTFNPFGFNYSDEEYFEKEVQEIKHGRLAMIAAIGQLLQVKNSGLGITEYLGQAFSLPEERAVLSGMGTLGDYFPPNI